MLVTLKSIAIANFKSIISEYVEFNSENGLCFLGGKNEVDPNLGANGAGKSSLWDAVIWCLYGTSAKGNRSSQLISQGKDTVSVVMWVEVDGVEHCILRAYSPMRIHIDDMVETRNQKDVDNLVGLSKEKFLNSVVFGQGLPLFPDRSISERGELLDDILNLSLWMKCAELASSYQTITEGDLRSNNLRLKYLEGKSDALPDEESLITRELTWESELAAETALTECKAAHWADIRQTSIEELNTKLKKYKEALKRLLDTPKTDVDKIREQTRLKRDVLHSTVMLYSNLDSEIKTLTNKVKTLDGKDLCPTCNQQVSNHELIQKELQEDKVNLEHYKKVQAVTGEEWEELAKEVSVLEIAFHKGLTDNSHREEGIRIAEHTCGKLQSEIDYLVETFESHNPYLPKLSAPKADNPYTAQLEELKKAQTEIGEEKTKLLKEKEEIERKITGYQYWKHSFKRIRLTLISQVLEALSIEIKSALSALGLDGWSISLKTESETKSGTTKLGVQIEVHSPTMTVPWELWSGGESQRLRLAMSMGLASMIQRSSGVRYGFEVWDEPTAWLGDEGVTNLLDALRYRAESQKKAVWIVDHRALQSSSFDEIWTAVKTAEGTKVYKTIEET